MTMAMWEGELVPPLDGSRGLTYLGAAIPCPYSGHIGIPPSTPLYYCTHCTLQPTSLGACCRFGLASSPPPLHHPDRQLR